MDKYRNTPSEIVKIRMQFKAQVNRLRKTYEQFVVEKRTPQKKHFQDKLKNRTQLTPKERDSIKNQVSQKRHYSPNALFFSPAHSNSFSDRSRRHYQNQDSVRKILKQKCQRKKDAPLLDRKINSRNRSLSQQGNRTSNSIISHERPQKHSLQNYRPSKKIIEVYHRFERIIG